MVNSAIMGIVDYCARRCRQVLPLGVLLATVAAAYDVTHFSISTNTDDLISEKLPWHQRQSAFSSAFPPKGISIVVEAKTPEGAEQATNALKQDLSGRADLFRAVVQPDSGEFFQRNGLMFEASSDLKRTVGGL